MKKRIGYSLSFTVYVIKEKKTELTKEMNAHQIVSKAMCCTWFVFTANIYQFLFRLFFFSVE